MEQKVNDIVNSIISQSFHLDLPFGEGGRGVQFSIFSNEKQFCPFCLGQLSYNNKGIPHCTQCKDYDEFHKQVEDIIERSKKISDEALMLNSKIEEKAKLSLKQCTINTSKTYIETFEKLIKDLEEEDK